MLPSNLQPGTKLLCIHSYGMVYPIIAEKIYTFMSYYSPSGITIKERPGFWWQTKWFTLYMPKEDPDGQLWLYGIE